MVDYHIHTTLCSHARGEMKEYTTQAARLGLEEIGFADHFPVNVQPQFSTPIRTITMSEEQIKVYLEDLEKAISQNRSISIRKGFEVDYLPGENLFFSKYLKLLPELDYIIGSVHFINEWGFDQPEFKDQVEKTGVKGLWTKYMSLVKEMVEGYGQYIDCLGHLDLPKKLSWPFPETLEEERLDLLKLIKEKDLVVEVNTAGFDKPCRELYPAPDLLRLIHERKIEITLGSDSHAPEEVARHYTRTREMLKSIGFKRIIKFNGHKKNYALLS